MRKLIVAEFMSLDGVIDSLERWHFPFINDQMNAVLLEVLSESDTMLLGRVTYQSYAGAFANASADDPVAAAMNKPEKIVVSEKLDQLEWRNSRRLSGNVIEQVNGLKTQRGGSILTSGSVTLARDLLRAGLVDEINLLIHPIVVGSGRRLFEDTGEIALDLVRFTSFDTGVVNAVYSRK